MTQTVRVQWPVVVGRLTVDPALVGQSLDLGTHDDVAVAVRFPTEIDESLISGPIPEKPAGSVTAAEAGAAIGVTYGDLALTVELTTEMDDLATIADTAPTGDQEDEVKALRRRATGAVELAFRRFVELLAVTDKRFAITVERPPLQHLGRLTVGDPGVHIGWGHDPVNLTVMGGGEGIPGQTVQQVAGRVRAGEEPKLRWLLFREAFRRILLEDDPRPAALEAATAVEVGIKTGLRDKDGSAVVEMLVEASRLEDLLKRAAGAVLGQSYADADKANYDLVIALIQQRNALVHRGQAPDLTALRAQLPAIRALLEWIDQTSA